VTGARTRYNWPLLLAVLATIGLLAALSPGVVPAGVALALLLLGFALPQFHLDRIGELILILFSGVAAYVVVMVLGEPDAYLLARGIGPIGASFGLFFLFVAITRLYQKRPYGRDPATAAAIFLAVLSLGGISSGRIYPISAMTVLILLVAACRFGDVARPSFFKLNRKNQVALAVMLTAWAALFLGFITALPIAYNYGFSILREAYFAPSTGFGFSMALGDLDGLLQSETLVMRITGPKPDHLRGAIYTRYSNGRWLSEKGPDRENRQLDQSRRSTEGVTTITYVGGERSRFFIPLDARLLKVNGSGTVITPGGIYMPMTGEQADTASFKLMPDYSENQGAVSDEHLLIPEHLAAVLDDQLTAWGLKKRRGVALLDALETRLKQEFDYTLHVDMGNASDPLVGFLTQTKRGHCEYFASAMALLARAGKIPTRVVGGYRVHELNPIGGYHVVREKNAHAWIEAYIDGVGWRTIDPTPAVEVFLPENAKTPFLSALMDVIADKVRNGFRAISEMEPMEMISIIASLLLIWIFVRLVRRIRQKRHKAASRESRVYSSPPAVLEQLLTALGDLGMNRRWNEPLETFAARLEKQAESGDDAVLTAAGLMRRYTAWRFGDEGDETALVAAFSAWLASRE
jgi:hypothetical protein